MIASGIETLRPTHPEQSNAIANAITHWGALRAKVRSCAKILGDFHENHAE